MSKKLLRSILWLFLAACLAGPVTFAPPAAADDSNVEAIITYYSDATHTTVVGFKTVFCDGQVTISGTVTRFGIPRFFPCLISQ